MLATVYTCAVIGLEAQLVQVEVHAGPGNPGIIIVGLPDTAIQESRERIRSAIRNSALRVPAGRVIVNLAPADIRKEGPAYDLPIALGTLLASQQIVADLSETMVIGELSLDGSLRHTNGILPVVSLARDRGFKRVLVPSENAAEAALIDGLEVIPVNNLIDLVRHLFDEEPIQPYPNGMPEPDDLNFDDATDLQHIRGQEHVKRGLEVGAAGGHNLLRFGTRRHNCTHLDPRHQVRASCAHRRRLRH
jgi:magnesium chelatase family protein